MKLESNRLYLRPLKNEDANGVYPTWLNDKEVCKYNSHGDTYYTKKMALNYINMVNNNPKCIVFAIIDKKSDKHIGNISLQQINTKNKTAEFAILMGEKQFWNKGLATEAGKLLIKYGLNQLKLHKIYCGTSEANLPMQKLASNLGMKKTGTSKKALEKNNQLFDIYNYSLSSIT
jgi:RimJ/RimL family protein N-acetyltransferase